MFFMHVFKNVFIKLKKTCIFMFFYLQINVFNIYDGDDGQANMSKSPDTINQSINQSINVY